MEGLPSGYRPNVGVCLINDDNLVFVASRLNVPGAWQMPQGGIEDGEDPRSAAIRELREETGIVSAEIIDEVSEWLSYDFPPTVKAKVNRLWGGGEWQGQAQKWFLMRLNKDESEINLASGEAEPEFSEWKWARPEEVIEQAVDYKRPTYEVVMGTFAPYLNDSGKATKYQSSRFLMRLTKDESEINLASGESEPEFSEWKWARPEEVIGQAVDYKRPTYEVVMGTFAPYLNDNGKATKYQSSRW